MPRINLRGKLIILKHLSKFHLLNFARCRVWHFLDVLHIVWNPPLRDFPVKEGFELKTFLDGKIAKWWIPDDVQYIEEMPHTATGKIQKMKLREMFEDYQFPA